MPPGEVNPQAMGVGDGGVLEEVRGWGLYVNKDQGSTGLGEVRSTTA
jgi:hypothetical protein